MEANFLSCPARGRSCVLSDLVVLSVDSSACGGDVTTFDWSPRLGSLRREAEEAEAELAIGDQLLGERRRLPDVYCNSHGLIVLLAKMLRWLWGPLGLSQWILLGSAILILALMQRYFTNGIGKYFSI